MGLRARNYTDHLELAGGAQRACVWVSAKIPLDFHCEELERRKTTGLSAQFLLQCSVCVCVFMWVPIKALVWVSAALHGQLYVHFLYMSECTHTHLWGIHVPHWLALGTQQSCTYLFSSDRRYCPWDTEPSMLGYLEQLAWLKGHILLASFLAKLSVTFWRWSVYICLRFDFG